eukprot:235684-Rhodomonas_salina.4
MTQPRTGLSARPGPGEPFGFFKLALSAPVTTHPDLNGGWGRAATGPEGVGGGRGSKEGGPCTMEL